MVSFDVCIFDVNGVLLDSNAANALAMGALSPKIPSCGSGWPVGIFN